MTREAVPPAQAAELARQIKRLLDAFYAVRVELGADDNVYRNALVHGLAAATAPSVLPPGWTREQAAFLVVTQLNAIWDSIGEPREPQGSPIH